MTTSQLKSEKKSYRRLENQLKDVMSDFKGVGLVGTTKSEFTRHIEEIRTVKESIENIREVEKIEEEQRRLRGLLGDFLEIAEENFDKMEQKTDALFTLHNQVRGAFLDAGKNKSLSEEDKKKVIQISSLLHDLGNSVLPLGGPIFQANILLERIKKLKESRDTPSGDKLQELAEKVTGEEGFKGMIDNGRKDIEYAVTTINDLLTIQGIEEWPEELKGLIKVVPRGQKFDVKKLGKQEREIAVKKLRKLKELMDSAAEKVDLEKIARLIADKHADEERPIKVSKEERVRDFMSFPAYIRRIVDNFVKNAVGHSDKGKIDVNISLGKEKDVDMKGLGKIEVGDLKDLENAVRISVTNNGVIDDEILDLLYKERVSDGVQTELSGGLGSLIALKAMMLLGGKIEVLTGNGKTTFTLFLPFKEVPENEVKSLKEEMTKELLEKVRKLKSGKG